MQNVAEEIVEFKAEQDNLDELIAQIRGAAIEDIRANHFDDQVKQAIEFASMINRSINYKSLAFAIFAGRQMAVTPLNLKLLSLFLVALDGNLPVKIQSFKIIFAKAWQDIKTNYRSPEVMHPEPQPVRYGYYVDQDQTADSPEAYCTVIYGGGWFFLQEFLAAKNKGYALDFIGGKFPGYGIYVTPINSGYQRRAYNYALRAATRCCDIPVIMTARIQQQYLVKTPNSSYEIGVPGEHHDKLTDIKLTRMSIAKCASNTSNGNPYGETELIIASQIAQAYPNDPYIAEDFQLIEADIEKYMGYRSGLRF